jgi:O-antigen/teichoic acid export membrane protein
LNAPTAGRGAFLRMLSGAVAVQIILSASNFAVGLLLVRQTTDEQYGYYVLITTAILFGTTLQGSFIQPPMIIRLTRAAAQGRSDLIGGLYRDQRRLLPFVGVLLLVLAIGFQLAGQLTLQLAAILVCGALAFVAALRREFFRMVLFAYRRPNDVLHADFVYCILLVAGAFAATLTRLPAAVAATGLALAGFVGGTLLSRALWAHEPWNVHAPTGMLKEIAPQGAWSGFGGTAHWLFSQGYGYLVAGAIDVTAVAALAATRLFVMPVALLSIGIGTLMLPTASKWNKDHPPTTVLRRLALFAAGMATMAACYLGLMWLARDWIFAHVLKKHFAGSDGLLLVWSANALVTVFRDQLLYFLSARGRFRATSILTASCAVISLSGGFVLMRYLGAVGASLGLLIAEIINTTGIVILSIREARRSVALSEPLSSA